MSRKRPRDSKAEYGLPPPVVIHQVSNEELEILQNSRGSRLHEYSLVVFGAFLGLLPSGWHAGADVLYARSSLGEDIFEIAMLVALMAVSVVLRLGANEQEAKTKRIVTEIHRRAHAQSRKKVGRSAPEKRAADQRKAEQSPSGTADS